MVDADLEARLPGMYRTLHAAGAFPGVMWRHHRAALAEFLTADAFPVLDFGCGPRGGLAEEYGDRAIPYDPHVPRYAGDPWDRSPGGLCSFDVLEHLTLGQLCAFGEQVYRTRSIRRVFLAVSVREARRLLPDGTNAHLTVRPLVWWRGFLDCALGRRFAVERFKYDKERRDFVITYVTTET